MVFIKKILQWIKKPGNFKLVIFILMVLLIIGALIISSIRTKRIRKNHFIVCGTVSAMRAGKGVNVIFSYTYQGIRYEFNESSPKKTYENYKNGNYSLRIAIDKDNPKCHVILSKDEDYEKYDIATEDTMNVKCH